MGIEILPPDINLSHKHFSVSDGKIVYGLVGIKNVGAGAVDELERERESEGPYKSFLDFAERVDNRSINRKVIEMVILTGLFDSLGEDRSRLYGNLDRVLGHAAGRRESRLAGQVSLFEGSDEIAFTYEPAEPWSDLERLTHERELLGFYFSGHPLDAHRERWVNSVTLDLSRAASASTDRVHRVLGLLKGLRIIQTKKGSQMAFGTLEDFKGSIELVFFSDPYEQCKDDLVDDTVIGIEGKVDTSRGRVQFVVERTIKPDEMPLKDTGEVHIRIADCGPTEDDFYHLRAFLFERSGGCSVHLHLNGNEDTEEVTVRASEQLMVSSNPSTLNEIQAHPQVLEVWKV
ncbi:MAG: DNA polymerase III subunit alpha, partial [Spirochaetaceae bacterium]|nr:DNA polymerase III subunit alpha [Spirochaetaceae bacterium]